MRAGAIPLERGTSQEVERRLEQAKGIVLPVGSTEQHGPAGLIGTNALCAQLIARGVGEAYRRAGRADRPSTPARPSITWAFAGTLTLHPQILLAVLLDLLGSLARQRFEHCLVINGHGGNMAATMAAFSELHARASLAAP